MPKMINFDISDLLPELVRIGQGVEETDRCLYVYTHISIQPYHLSLICLDSQAKSCKGRVTPKAYHKSFGCDYQGQLHTHNFL